MRTLFIGPASLQCCLSSLTSSFSSVSYPLSVLFLPAVAFVLDQLLVPFQSCSVNVCSPFRWRPLLGRKFAHCPTLLEEFFNIVTTTDKSCGGKPSLVFWSCYSHRQRECNQCTARMYVH
ncbi:hypothetical protein CRM22_004970 [Opisthorchis felineus]|uniref:Uncharacterized protein n=1 Tax=Opisthorchis felineus TaxID=147828 RepID=A0A4S2LTG8_OPIFE|nr:hypothetical protein CRM22_004970 [Opisthorchis felineus]